MTMTMSMPGTEVFFPRISNPRLHHTQLFYDVLGQDFYTEIITRAVLTTIYDGRQSAILLDNNLAYLIARSKMEDPDDSLVCCLLPDQLWHLFQIYNEEYRRLCMHLAGQWLRHDPAGESALINRVEDIAKTVGLFRAHGIGYHPELWRDHLMFPHGAKVIKTGIAPLAA